MSDTRFLLNPQSLATKVAAASYERGLALYRSQHVLDYTLTAAASHEWDIEGEVLAGSRGQTYAVRVKLETGPDGKLAFFSGLCDCPVAIDCKHCVALTFKVAYKSGGVVSQYRSNDLGARAAPITAETPATVEARRLADIERERLAAQGKLGQWLGLFDNEPVEPSREYRAAAHHSSEADVIVYVLIPAIQAQRPVLKLGHGLVRRMRNGNWGKVRAQRYNERRGATAQDFEIMRLIETLAGDRHTYSYGPVLTEGILAGEVGLLALRLASATGRLFLSSELRVMGPAISVGSPRTLGWGWHEVTGPTSPEPQWALRPQLAPATHPSATGHLSSESGQGGGADAAGAAPDGASKSSESGKLNEPSVSNQPDGVASGAVAAGQSHTGGGSDAGGAVQCFASQPPLYLDTQAGLCGPLETPGVSAEHLRLLMQAPVIAQSAFAAQEALLLRHLGQLPLPPVIVPPRVVRGVVPVARLHIGPVAADARARLGLLCATLRFDYEGLQHYSVRLLNPVLIEPAASGSGEGAQRVLLHRDMATEQSAVAALQALGLVGDAQGAFRLPLLSEAQQAQWLHWADADFAPLREAGFVLDVAPSLADWIARADLLDVRMQAPDAPGGTEQGDDLVGGDDSRSPWFELSLGMEISGERHNILPLLPALLQSLSAAHNSTGGAATAGATLQMPPFVYLSKGDGSYLRLPTEPLRPWLQALLDLVGERSVKFEGDSLRLTRLEALRVGASLGEGVRWQGADTLRQMVRQLAGQSALPEVALPEGLQATLRPYQRQGLDWLQFLRANGLAGILADEMGLGKTLQTLAHILVEKNAGRLDRPALVIAPVSLMGNWRREAARFTPELRTLVLHGKERHEVADQIATHDLVIAPYSLLPRDRARWTKQAWHIVVLDEAQNIKNADTHAAQVAGELDTRHRLCLSGTPMENHLGELWSLFHFLMPGFLGSQARFKQLFRTPIEKLGDSERLHQLRLRVTPFMLRRAKRDVATDLPDKQEAVTTVELQGKQADLYETIRLTTEQAVRSALADKGLAKSQIQILDALLKLRQVCCDPRLVPIASAKKINQSAKLELLMELLPEMLAEGRKVLLFSQFTSMLALIEEELAKRGIEWVKLTGQSQKRDALIERFTSGAVPLFLISLKAGGVGLNLPQADTVIHYDPWWNPAVENQATDRAHRIGQTQRVLVYKLVAQGTIEERILALQERKAALAESMYSGSQARKQPLFTEGDLAELLKPLGT